MSAEQPAEQDAAPGFHTSPACWDAPRIYHSAPLPQELENQVHLIAASSSATVPGEASLSPNGAYRFWVRQPDTTKPGPWGAGLIVDTERKQRPVLLFQNVISPLQPRWLNEKLIFLRIVWGRIIFSDLIFDVEKRKVIYHEQAIYGETAFWQYQQSCDGKCPCPTGSASPLGNDVSGDVSNAVPNEAPSSEAPVNDAVIVPDPDNGRKTSLHQPAAVPNDNALIGLVKIPVVFGSQQPGDVPDRSPVPVYASPESAARKLGEPHRPQDFQTREYAYERPAAVVYAARPGWYLIGMADGSKVWLSDKSAGQYLPIGELLTGHQAYLNHHWDRKLWRSPTIYEARNSRLKRVEEARVEYAVNILEAQPIGDGLWLRVETLDMSPCNGGKPRVIDRGWVPAYSQGGDLVADYYSRGC